MIVATGLEEEMPGLPAGHRDQPADQSADCRALEHDNVRRQKADRAQKMQRLIDPAVVVVAMIVPPLRLQSLQKAFHGFPLFAVTRSSLWRFRNAGMTGARSVDV